jgi:hypothetical protein
MNQGEEFEYRIDQNYEVVMTNAVVPIGSLLAVVALFGVLASERISASGASHAWWCICHPRRYHHRIRSNTGVRAHAVHGALLIEPFPGWTSVSYHFGNASSARTISSGRLACAVSLNRGTNVISQLDSHLIIFVFSRHAKLFPNGRG